MDDVYKIKRSFSNPDVYYLQKEGKEDELFQQADDARRPDAICFDPSNGFGELCLFRTQRG